MTEAVQAVQAVTEKVVTKVETTPDEIAQKRGEITALKKQLAEMRKSLALLEQRELSLTAVRVTDIKQIQTASVTTNFIKALEVGGYSEDDAKVLANHKRVTDFRDIDGDVIATIQKDGAQIALIHVSKPFTLAVNATRLKHLKE